MRNSRPVNLDLLTIKQPLPAMVSITHRATGVMLFIGLALIFYLFDMSLAGEQGFVSAQALLRDNLFVKFVTWGLLVSLAFHLFAGMKHLLQDLGMGEEFDSAMVAAKIVIGVTFLAAICAGVWIW